MCNRNRLTIAVLALLCSQGLSVRAGSIGYEALDGNRCTVSTDSPSQIQLNSGYNEYQGANASFGLSIPLSDSTASARTNCVKFAELDQSRQHFTWLLDLYERGAIDRKSLEAQAEALGITLAPETSSQGGMSVILQP